jgi:hypothetical protein
MGVPEPEIADAQEGGVRKYGILSDSCVVAEFRDPKPLPTRKD